MAVQKSYVQKTEVAIVQIGDEGTLKVIGMADDDASAYDHAKSEELQAFMLVPAHSFTLQEIDPEFLKAQTPARVRTDLKPAANKAASVKGETKGGSK